MLAVLSHHGLVRFLVLNSIDKILIPWEWFQNSTREEIEASIDARTKEPEAMQEDKGKHEAMQRDEEDDYVDQEEPEEMEMETEECEEESAFQMQAESIEAAETPIGTSAEATPQEPAQSTEPVEQIDRVIGTEVTP